MTNIHSDPNRRSIDKPTKRKRGKADPMGCPVCGGIFAPVAGLLRCPNGHAPKSETDGRERDYGHVLPSPGGDEQVRPCRPRGPRDGAPLNFEE